jgi:hypothetical protein
MLVKFQLSDKRERLYKLLSLVPETSLLQNILNQDLDKLQQYLKDLSVQTMNDFL